MQGNAGKNVVGFGIKSLETFVMKTLAMRVKSCFFFLRSGLMQKRFDRILVVRIYILIMISIIIGL